MKKGISLIVMLITIVVIIILAASIINTVIYNSPMDNAKEAAFRSDLQEMKYAYGIRQGELMAKYKGDKYKITEADYEGVVHRNYEGEILAFEGGLAYLGKDKKKQEIAESMDYIIGNPNDSVLRYWTEGSQDDFHNKEYRAKITKIKFITNNKVPKGVVESWDVSAKNNGSVMAWVVGDGNEGYELTIGGNGKVIANSNSQAMLYNFKALREVDIKALDTSKVKNMFRMFSDCSNLINLDLSNFNLKNVTNLQMTFYYCTKLESIKIDFSSANKVAITHGLFEGCPNLVNVDVSTLNTSNIRDMHIMFYNCQKIKTSITIKNPNTYSYSGTFNNAATANGAEIIVNYTSETNDLVDKIINTKSENSNVKKGELVSN